MIIQRAEQEKLRFTVEDTGSGIPEEKQKQLFSMFVNVVDKGFT